jgi:hypothetical protein
MRASGTAAATTDAAAVVKKCRRFICNAPVRPDPITASRTAYAVASLHREWSVGGQGGQGGGPPSAVASKSGQRSRCAESRSSTEIAADRACAVQISSARRPGPWLFDAPKRIHAKRPEFTQISQGRIRRNPSHLRSIEIDVVRCLKERVPRRAPDHDINGAVACRWDSL